MATATPTAKRLVIVGTGTEIGKTHVTCALAGLLDGVLALKPVESGGVADAEALSRACGVVSTPRYALPEPISPHLAARRAGTLIELNPIVSWVREREAEAGPRVTLVETAGGLFSPLAPGVDNAALAEVLCPDIVVLVAPDRLGVLHDVTSVLRAWPSLSLPPPHIVLSAPAVADAATGSNAAELAELEIADVVAVFPRAPVAAAATLRAARQLIDSLGQFFGASELTNVSC